MGKRQEHAFHGINQQELEKMLKLIMLVIRKFKQNHNETPSYICQDWQKLRNLIIPSDEQKVYPQEL